MPNEEDLFVSSKTSEMTILLFSQLTRNLSQDLAMKNKQHNTESKNDMAKKNKALFIAPMLLPDHLKDEETREFDKALNLYMTLFDVIPGVQGLGETFSFVVNSNFYKPLYGHFTAKVVDTHFIKNKPDLADLFKTLEKDVPNNIDIKSNIKNQFVFDDNRDNLPIDELKIFASIRDEIFFPYNHQDLILRQNEISQKSMIIRPLINRCDTNDNLYKISPFMTSYCLLGIISNFIN